MRKIEEKKKKTGKQILENLGHSSVQNIKLLYIFGLCMYTPHFNADHISLTGFNFRDQDRNSRPLILCSCNYYFADLNACLGYYLGQRSTHNQIISRLWQRQTGFGVNCLGTCWNSRFPRPQTSKKHQWSTTILFSVYWVLFFVCNLMFFTKFCEFEFVGRLILISSILIDHFNCRFSDAWWHCILLVSFRKGFFHPTVPYNLLWKCCLIANF